MALIAIPYHSGYGHTKRVAEFVAEGANSVEGITAILLNVDDIDFPTGDHATGWELLDAAHGIIFGSPTYMGGVSGPFKVFADKTSKAWFTQGWKDKVAAGFTNSLGLSGDKLSTLQYFVTLSQQHGMIWVGQGEPARTNTPDSINRVSSSTGLMTQSDNVPPEESPSSGDIETAKLFGARIATSVKRWNGIA